MKLQIRIIETVVLLTLFYTTQAQIKIPFEVKENKIILLKIPGVSKTDTTIFFFDTGAMRTMIDDKIAERNNIKSNFEQGMQGGTGAGKKYSISLNNKLYLTQEIAIDNFIYVIDDFARMTSLVGKKFDGVIGVDIAKNYVTKIDFDKKIMTLNPFNEAYDTTGYTPIKFYFKRGLNIPQFPITIELENGEKYSGDIIFDSGLSHPLLLNTPFIKENDIANKIGKKVSVVYNTLNTKSDVSKAIIKSIELDKFKLSGKILTTLTNEEKGVSSYKDFLGFLGYQIISKFNFIVDYSTNTLYLKPNETFNQPIIAEISPIDLIVNDDKFFISNVMKGTKAASKGLKEGDEIISINGKTTNDVSTFREMLLQVGKKVKIKYRDENNQIKTCKFKLKKIL